MTLFSTLGLGIASMSFNGSGSGGASFKLRDSTIFSSSIWVTAALPVRPFITPAFSVSPASGLMNERMCSSLVPVISAVPLWISFSCSSIKFISFHP
jgi:hypothetical protein